MINSLKFAFIYLPENSSTKEGVEPYGLDPGRVEVQLLDLYGGVIRRWPFQAAGEGDMVKIVDISPVPAGTYFVKVLQGKRFRSLKVMVH